MIGLSLALLAYVLTASAARSVNVKVSAPDAVSDVDDLDVSTTITNTGDETLKLLKDPRTPLSSFATNTFVVTNVEGLSPEFRGVKVRYAPEIVARSGGDSSFTVLAPGESVDVPHEVGLYYNFTSCGPGDYKFDPVNVFNVLEGDGSVRLLTADTTPATVKLSGKLSTTKSLSPNSLGRGTRVTKRAGLGKRASYTSCTSTMQTQTGSAISTANTYATRSVSHLNSNPSGSSLQTTWWGTFSSSRRTLALTTYTRLQSTPNSWTYDCSCTDPDVYAFVYPSQYGVVYLCGLFWNVPATGSGSRADTIIHEGTHFPQILGTDDYAYGESACKSLAASQPNTAIYNADNYAFFSVYT